LLDIDSVAGDAGKLNVAVFDIGNLISLLVMPFFFFFSFFLNVEIREVCGAYTSSGTGVCLDTASVGAVLDNGVGEGHSIYNVVTLSANGANAQTMPSAADHVGNGNIRAAGNSNTVILVCDRAVSQQDVVRRGKIKPV
jgi:hypothetical protein